MIKHIVMWKLKEQTEDGTMAENAATIKEKLEALSGEIPELKKVEVGIGIDLPGSTWDVVLYTEFESQAALDEI
ncbi:MAG: Dabb family protein [Spirochaetales bacterium]|uniref:Dabb family protein n=1 Tax=Candidatus Thalassospirochaeta sargassi TaxID=3119039 RepID=A0AAJ1IF56_9SPIO|nr:Dabb family protein [Spirochaetales bacterium]